MKLSTFFGALRFTGGAIGCLLQIVLWGGGSLLHLLAGIIIIYKHGIIVGIFALGIPGIASIYAIILTIASGSWIYSGLVLGYIVIFVISTFLVVQDEEM